MQITRASERGRTWRTSGRISVCLKVCSPVGVRVAAGGLAVGGKDSFHSSSSSSLHGSPRLAPLDLARSSSSTSLFLLAATFPFFSPLFAAIGASRLSFLVSFGLFGFFVGPIEVARKKSGSASCSDTMMRSSVDNLSVGGRGIDRVENSSSWRGPRSGRRRDRD